MTSFKRILVALDFSASDESLLKYTAGWCEKFNPEHVYFLNVQKNLAVPEKLAKYLTPGDKPLDEELRSEMAKRINQFFPNFKQYHYEFDVIEGNPRDSISHWTKVKNVDLLLVGVKEESKGRGILPQQLLRNVKCSVLFVPEHSTFSLKSICVPVKLGSQKDVQLDLAIDLVEEGGKVVASHFYSVPSSYHMMGGTGMLLDSIREESEMELDELIGSIKKENKKYEVVKALDSVIDFSLTGAIEKNSKANNCDLIIMLAGRKSMIETFLIGSETEAMVKKNKEFNLLIYKH
ncbi:MAG: universal stress protein [Chitinophagales bacterium]